MELNLGYPKNPIELIQQEWASRRERNPALSLRSFARFLQISPGRLSEVLSGKRKLSIEMADRIAERLALNPEARKVFLGSVLKNRRQTTRTRALQRKIEQTIEYRQLSLDAFHIISDWYHFAILNLRDCDDFVCKADWIAQRLNLNVSEVKLALVRLERVGMIEWKGETWVRTCAHLATTNDISSAALRKGHKQLLQKAADSLEAVEIHQRDITAMTIAIDAKRLPEAKQTLKKFRRKFAKDFEKGNDRTEVYTLAMQLFPLTQIRKEKKR